jgi:YidC/Oxa1 family membrane protein insertase
MTENRNILLALTMSVLVMVIWYVFFAGPQMRAEEAKAHQAALLHHDAPQAGPQTTTTGAELPMASAPAAKLSRAAALKQSGARIAIDTPTVDGTLLLKGARFDDLRLKLYRETVDPKSPEIVLFSPKGTAFPYFTQYGWLADSATPAAVPGEDTQWTLASGTVLSPGHPVTLNWDNGHGLVFTRTISVDAQYMFTVSDAVANKSGKAVRLLPYAQVVRNGVPEDKRYMSLHEGFVGWVNNGLNDPAYDELKPESPAKTFHSTAGWLGITDKYWMATLITPQNEEFDGGYHFSQSGNAKTWWAEYKLGAKTVAPGTTITETQRFFAGAKKYDILVDYRDRTGVPSFEYAIDWGWYFFITKPMFWLLDTLYRLAGNFGLAIILLTIVVRLLFFPIANTQFKSMSRMKKLQPQVESIKARFADDKPRQQTEMMELYKREKVNPVSGCLPILIQIPVFFSLYKVLLVTIEMRHAPFIGWIHDLSAPDPTTYFNLFGLLPWSAPDSLPSFLNSAVFVLHIGIWPLLMGATQWLQTKLNPAPADPVQASMMTYMPLIFTAMLSSFPAGLVIYYAWSNLLSIAQQWFIMSRQGVEIHLFKSLPFGLGSQRTAAPAPKIIEGKAKDVTDTKKK